LVNLFDQIGPGHLAHLRCITKKSSTLLPGAPEASLWLGPSSSPSGQRPRRRPSPSTSTRAHLRHSVVRRAG
jgi:hypothetical protein